jgi:hypothetical protein
MRKLTVLCLGVLLAAFLAGPALAQGILITVDENGNGSYSGQTLPYYIGPDPTGGVPSNVLIYPLLFDVAPGDVLLFEPGSTSFSDVIRFIPIGTIPMSQLIFYSDNTPGADAQADVGLPEVLSSIRVSISELGPEGNNGAYYTPLLGQPGYGTGMDITYHFISDVPLPPSVWLLGSGLLGLAGLRRKLFKV